MNNPRREHSAGLLARPGGRAERAAARETASAVRLILRGGQRRNPGKKSWSAIRPTRVARKSREHRLADRGETSGTLGQRKSQHKMPANRVGMTEARDAKPDHRHQRGGETRADRRTRPGRLHHRAQAEARARHDASRQQDDPWWIGHLNCLPPGNPSNPTVPVIPKDSRTGGLTCPRSPTGGASSRSTAYTARSNAASGRRGTTSRGSAPTSRSSPPAACRSGSRRAAIPRTRRASPGCTCRARPWGRGSPERRSDSSPTPTQGAARHILHEFHQGKGRAEPDRLSGRWIMTSLILLLAHRPLPASRTPMRRSVRSTRFNWNTASTASTTGRTTRARSTSTSWPARRHR